MNALALLDPEPTTLAEMHAAHKARQLRFATGTTPIPVWLDRCETVFAVCLAVRWLADRRAAASAKEAKRLGVWSDRLFLGDAPTPEDILRQVARKHSLSPSELTGRSRYVPIPAGRFEAYYRLRTELLWSYPAIALYMKRDDHSSVVHGVTKHCEANALPYPRLQGLYSRDGVHGRHTS